MITKKKSPSGSVAADKVIAAYNKRTSSASKTKRKPTNAALRNQKYEGGEQTKISDGIGPGGRKAKSPKEATDFGQAVAWNRKAQEGMAKYGGGSDIESMRRGNKALHERSVKAKKANTKMMGNALKAKRRIKTSK